MDVLLSVEKMGEVGFDSCAVALIDGCVFFFFLGGGERDKWEELRLR